MKVLTYHNRLGPAVVFLPPAKGRVPESAAVPADPGLLRSAYSEVAAMGSKTTWAKHCQALVKSPPYAGTWTVEDVPGGYSAEQALAWIRSQASSASLEPPVPAGT